ncbi:hypothetical protein B484DRAFT_427032 [Ochromonadaceae sp. CCMP2298]|nr:hypothetical protein B484DRAFT_427032 [Ochromonadaceae sp. CCMP2298]
MKRATHLFGKALRETGQAVDRVGLTFANNEIFNETFSRHRPVMSLFDKMPAVAAGVFVAPNATVVGAVTLGADVSVGSRAVVPSGEMWAGNPAKKVREVRAEELAHFTKSAEHYVTLSKEHAAEFKA